MTASAPMISPCSFSERLTAGGGGGGGGGSDMVRSVTSPGRLLTRERLELVQTRSGG